MIKESTDFKKELYDLYDRCTQESKEPLNKFSRCKRLVNEMCLSREAEDKILQIILQDIGYYG